MRVAVIGAGAAGATAAYCLAQGGVEVDVYEASGGTGGRSGSVELWGQTVGLGARHFASTDPRVNALWLEVVGGDYEMVEARVRVFRDGRLTPPSQALAGRIWDRVGPSLAQLRPLVERVRDRVSRRAGVAFAHPRQGAGEVYARMCDQVEKRGGRVHLDSPVAHLTLDGTRVTGVRLNTGELLEHDHVVSSMPLAGLAGRLPAAPPGVAAAGARLALRHTVFVYVRTTGESVFPDTWIDVCDPGLRTARITNFDNWVPAAKRGEAETVLALEYHCGIGDEFWQWEDEEYLALARSELVATGLVGGGEILGGEVLRAPKSGPAAGGALREQLAVVGEHLRGLEGLEVIGATDGPGEAMLLGLLAAENVLEDAGHDLWSVTPHPRTSRITATGLVLD